MPQQKTPNPGPLLSKLDFDALARVNYSFFVQYTNPGYKHGRHTRYISNVLQDIEDKHRRGIPTFTIFMLPPRHSKSFTITESFPAWFIGKDPSRRVIEVSYGAELARKFGLSNLRKIDGDAGRIFNIELDPRQAAAHSFSLQGHRGGMLSAGVGGAITGEGADLLIIDDPIRNRRDANSETYREMIWNEWKSTLSTRLQPGGSVILILTRWHEDDLAGRLLEQDGRQWNVIRLPALAEENDPLDRAPGEPLWPESGYDSEWAQLTKKSVGPLDWESLYQQRPGAQGGTLLLKKYFNYYDRLPPFSVFERIIQSWDCTFKNTETSDFVAGQVWGKAGPDFYLLDQLNERMGIIDTMQEIQNMSLKWPQAQGIYIEDKANGPAVIEMLKQRISGIIPVEPRGGKVVRAQAVLPFLAAGNVYLPHPHLSELTPDLVTQAANFPYGKHDDMVDAMTQALNELTRASHNHIFIGRA